jgi:hypothetical protein
LRLRETILDCLTSAVEINHYPNLFSRDRPEAANGNYLWHDVYDAFESGHYQLAAMGARAVIEAYMADKVGDRGTFQKTLEAFHADGNLSSYQHDSLQTLIEVGHASTHRGFEPSKSEVADLLDMLENVIVANDHLPMVASILRDTVERSAPKRKPHSKNKP